MTNTSFAANENKIKAIGKFFITQDLRQKGSDTREHDIWT